MKRPKLRRINKLLLGLLLPLAAPAQTDRACGHSQGVFARSLVSPGQQALLRQEMEAAISSQMALQAAARPADALIRIPVVVHVLHNNPDSLTIGGGNNPNISEAQIQSQLRILNQDYRRAAGTPGFNTNPAGADMEIEFYLATTDPAGRPTTGIVRRYTPRASYTLEELSQASRLSYWPTDRYLNIWVLPNIPGYAGFGQFPTAPAVPGLNQAYANLDFTDGVYIQHRYFGNTGTVSDPSYALGRTATHEIGHWLGLLHPNGDTYCGDDYCADTPPVERLNNTRFCDPLYSNCVAGQPTRNMIENYMDLSPDACMNVFTQHQKNRVRAVLAASPRRQQLMAGASALPQTPTLSVRVFPNPVQHQQLGFEATFQGQQPLRVQVRGLGGQLLYTEDLGTGSSRRVSVALPARLAAGVYLLQVSTGSETLRQRVVLL